MHRIICLFTFIVALSASCQVLSPTTPALTASPAFVPGSPVLAGDLNAPQTNASGSPANFTAGELSALLINLQAAMEQALPALGAFNNSFVFTNAPANMAANFSVNLGTNFSANLGSNFGVNFGTPAGPSSANPLFGAPGTVNATLRGMLVLQSEVEQMLPVLNALNGGTNSAGAGFAPDFMPGSLTNLFGP